VGWEKPTPSFCKDVEKLEPSCIAYGNIKWYSHFGKPFSSFWTVKNKLIDNSSIFPAPSPLQLPTLLSVFVSFTTLGISSKWNHLTFVFCNQFITLYVMSSRFTSIVVYVRISFYNWIIFHFVYHVLLIFSPVSRHLDCFYLLAIVNNAVGYKYPFQTLLSVLLGICPEV
jgi:hypothetical protein